MTERQFQAKLLKKLRSQAELKNAVIFKHTDMINGGIPDISITLNENTHWFELKVEPNKLSKLQAYYWSKLGARGHVVSLHKTGSVMINGQYFVDLRAAVDRIVVLCQL